MLIVVHIKLYECTGGEEFLQRGVLDIMENYLVSAGDDGRSLELYPSGKSEVEYHVVVHVSAMFRILLVFLRYIFLLHESHTPVVL